jgi:hypothetical protein
MVDVVQPSVIKTTAPPPHHHIKCDFRKLQSNLGIAILVTTFQLNNYNKIIKNYGKQPKTIKSQIILVAQLRVT